VNDQVKVPGFDTWCTLPHWLSRLACEVARSASTFQSPTLNLPFRPAATLSMSWNQRALLFDTLALARVPPTT
jgi:hypothetical protein